jgi:uncharacterized protein Yka (UPF0111/DUF47 family)
VRLLPRDEKFFDLFTSVTSLSVEAARLELDLLRAHAMHHPPLVDAIKRLEHDADQITHEVVTRLDRVFITHTITGAIVGVGAAQRVSAVRWGVARRIAR